MPGPVVVVIQYCQCVYRNPQTAKLEIGPACQRHIGVIFADMEIDYDKLAAAILRQQQQQQPSVVPDAAILNPSEQVEAHHHRTQVIFNKAQNTCCTQFRNRSHVAS